MPISVDHFVRHLVDSGLMPAAEVDAFLEKLPPDRKPRNGEELAKELHRQRRLTKYQARAVYYGETRKLRFGEYRILDRIGSGSMGEVFKAEHSRMRRVVALKVLRADNPYGERAVLRFQREVQVAARLEHPNVVGAHDAGEVNGQPFLVLQYVDGRNLDSLVKEQGPLSLDASVDLIIQTARGLAHAHAQGIVHRDIKPTNLLLDREGHIKILDMGLARIDDEEQSLEGEEASRLTLPGQMMGTVAYVSPEQAEDARHADARSDLYSLGCTFFFLLKGEPPYPPLPGRSTTLTILAHREAPIPVLCDEIPGTPPAVDAVFQRMLAKHPADRFATMHELIDALTASVSKTAPAKVAMTAVVESAWVTLDAGAIVESPAQFGIGSSEHPTEVAQNVHDTDTSPILQTGGGLVAGDSAEDSRGIVDPTHGGGNSVAEPSPAEMASTVHAQPKAEQQRGGMRTWAVVLVALAAAALGALAFKLIAT